MSSLMYDIQHIILTCNVQYMFMVSDSYLSLKRSYWVPLEASNMIRIFLSSINKFNFLSGYVTDEEIERREQELRRALQNDKKFRVRDVVSVEVAQVNQQS